MSWECPCCGAVHTASVSLEELKKVPWTGPVQNMVMRCLIEREGKVATHGELISYVWGLREPTRPEAGLSVVVSCLRKLLKNYGWTINNQHGVGYYLAPAAKETDDDRET